MGSINNTVDSIYGPNAQLPFVYDRFHFIDQAKHSGRSRHKYQQETPLIKAYTIQNINKLVK